ncbi:MAG: alpha/beta hydrolase [Gemmatimonadales bacterium]
MSGAPPAATVELEGFTHRFEPAAAAGTRRTLLLLHATGGTEAALLPLGRRLAPGAALLSPRGRVLEGTMPRFFRRLAEGVFDQADLALRTGELARFIRAATDRYRLDPAGVIAVGYSNGANIAGSLLLRHPGLLAGAVLFRPMLPYEPERPVVLPGTPVWLGAGRTDLTVPHQNVERLAQLLRDSGARVTLEWRDAGHQMTAEDVESAVRWLLALPA